MKTYRKRALLLILLGTFLNGCTESETIIEELGSVDSLLKIYNGTTYNHSISSSTDPVMVLGECDKRVKSIEVMVEGSDWSSTSTTGNYTGSEWDCEDGQFTFATPDISTLLSFSLCDGTETHSIQFKANTSIGESSPSILNLTCTAGGDTAPVVSNITPSSFNEDVESTITLTYTDADSDLATSCALSNLSNINETTACGCAAGVCTVGVTGVGNYNGSASFDFTVTANAAISNTASATLTINPVNDAPVIANVTCSTTATEDTAYACSYTGTDVDGDSLSFTVGSSNDCSGTGGGLVDNADDTADLTWTPDNQDVGTCDIGVEVSDGVLTDEDVFSMTIGNAAPSLSISSTTYGMARGAANETIFSDANVDSNDEGDGATYSLINPGAGSMCDTGSIGVMTINSSTGETSFDPVDTWGGVCRFRIRVNDGSVNVDSSDITVTVTPSPPSTITLNNPATSPNSDSTPELTVGGVISGDTVKLYSDSSCTTQKASGTSSGTSLNITSSALSDETVTFYANTEMNGVTSSCSTANVSYMHDGTPPGSPAISIQGGASYTGTTGVTLTLSATGATDMYITNTSGCGSGGSWETYGVSKPWTLGQTNGTATVYVKYRDTVQNETTCQSDTIVHDSTPPTFAGPVTANLYHGSSLTSPTANWSAATDGGSGMSHYEFAIGTTPGASDVFSFSDIGNILSYQATGLSLVDGTYYLSVRAIDLAGNTSSSVSRAFEVDITPPTMDSAVILSPGDSATYWRNEIIQIEVDYDESVTVDTAGGTPRLSITLDSGTVYADFVRKSSPDRLVFWYEVTSSDSDANGVIFGASLDLNGGLIYDKVNLSADLDPPSAIDGSSLLVDGNDFCVANSLTGATAYGVSGSGASGNPYNICTPAQFSNIGENCRSGFPTACNKYFIIRSDIDLAGYKESGPNIYYRIGDNTNRFSGAIDGKYYTISNLDYTSTVTHSGVFGYVDGASIQNLIFERISMRSNTSFTGVVAGKIENSTVSNVYVGVNSTATGGYQLGGFAGETVGNTFTSVGSDAHVSANAHYAGGLIGISKNDIIKYSYSNGDITGINGTEEYIGAFIGSVREGDIQESFATGDVWASRAGGFIGSINDALEANANGFSSIKNNYATGSVVVQASSASGFIARLEANDNTVDQFIKYNYSLGSASGGGVNNGGFVGYCYKEKYEDTGSVGPTDSTNFWDEDASGVTDDGGGNPGAFKEAIAKTTTEMQTKSTFEKEGWNFADVWLIDDGSDYPKLKNIWVPPLVSSPFTFFDNTNNTSFLKYTEGDVRVTLHTTAPQAQKALGAHPKSSGKWYVEFEIAKVPASSSLRVGLAASDTATTNFHVGEDTNSAEYSWGCLADTGSCYHNNTSAGSITIFDSNGAIVGIAFDADSGDVWFHVNGTWQGGDGPGGTGGDQFFSGVSDPQGIVPTMSLFDDVNTSVRMIFTNKPPPGYTHWTN